MKLVGLALVVLIFSACQTGYKRIGEGGTIMGYDEALIRTGLYRVTYQGQQGESPIVVYSNFVRRCAELAASDSAPYFKITEGFQGATQQATLMGLASFPSYTGTCTFSKTEGEATLNTEDTLKKAVASDKRAADKSKASTSPSTKQQKNPFAPSGF